jgi:hypothetical protein
MQRILDYFTNGTEATVSGSHIGMEIETDFLTREGKPISTRVSRAILETKVGKPAGSKLSLELGRQKLELAIEARSSFTELERTAHETLSWLYEVAKTHGAHPYHGPEVESDERLLWVQDARDALWMEMDGRAALEELCRCSSVQFTIDVHPDDACTWINALHVAKLQEVDYAANNRRWLNYMNGSLAGYDPLRYGGPTHFENLEEYVYKLTSQSVVMHKGQIVQQPVNETSDLDIDLFLRSVWWHYRLRRYKNTLTLEIRPFSRRGDDFSSTYALIGDILDL